MNSRAEKKSTEKLMNMALALSVITVVYNVAEGVFSTLFGFSDDTIALFGFGLDSFVEVISGAGILHMVLRIRKNPSVSRDLFERRALKITGMSFYLLAAGLVAGSAVNLVRGTKPETTFAGVVISGISILTMWLLYRLKLRTGKELGSEPIIADANCTKTCFYLSFVLLASSLLYELFQVGFVDAAGALGIAWFAFREGREAMEKSRSASLSCCCGGKNC